MINLLPPAIQEARRYGRRNVILLRYSIAIALIGVFSIGVFLFNMHYVNEDVSRLRVEMAEQSAQAKKLEEGQKNVDKIAGQLKTIDKLYTGEVKFSEMIPKIGALLPNGAVLNSLSLAGGKASPLQLDVDIESQDLAAVFQQNLVNSDLFSAADISAIVTKGISTNKSQKSYPYGATLTATFKGAPVKAETK